MRLAWATDIHLDHASESARRRFCQSVKEQADALVVTGDIAESHILGTALTPRKQTPPAFLQDPGAFSIYNSTFSTPARKRPLLSARKAATMPKMASLKPPTYQQPSPSPNVGVLSVEHDCRVGVGNVSPVQSWDSHVNEGIVSRMTALAWERP